MGCCCSVLICIQLFATPWTAAHQASLSFTVSRSMLRFTSFALLIPPNHLIPCYPFSFISIMPCISVDTRYRYVFIFTQSFAWALQEQKDENLCGPSYMGCSLLSHLSQSLSFLWLFFCSWPKYQDQGFYPWRRKWQPPPLQFSCLENSMDRGAWCFKSLGCKELDMTELTQHRVSIDTFLQSSEHHLRISVMLPSSPQLIPGILCICEEWVEWMLICIVLHTLH